MTDEEKKELKSVCDAVQELGGAQKAIACFAIAAKANMSIAKAHGILCKLDKKGFVEVEASGWRYVD